MHSVKIRKKNMTLNIQAFLPSCSISMSQAVDEPKPKTTEHIRPGEWMPEWFKVGAVGLLMSMNKKLKN